MRILGAILLLVAALILLVILGGAMLAATKDKAVDARGCEWKE